MCGPDPMYNVSLLESAAMELEEMRCDTSNHGLHPLPQSCHRLIKSLSGNQTCIDCSSVSPDWAAISYGALVCLRCSGTHRGLGVKKSCVRSMTMDNWSQAQVLAMLEGGNAQLALFFERHALVSDDLNNTEYRYRTKAARFYRENLDLHTSKVVKSGMYQGRDASRERRKSRDGLAPAVVRLRTGHT